MLEVLLTKEHSSILTPLSNAFKPDRLLFRNSQLLKEMLLDCQTITTAATLGENCSNSMFDT